MTSPASPVQPAGRGPLFWVAALILIAGIAGAVFWYQHRDKNALFLAGNAAKPGVTKTASGLQYQVLEPGDAKGPRPTNADVALITYEGRLTDGKVFDKSEQPVPLPVGQVVPGFSEGLKLMPKGAKYRFWIPPQLGYGRQAQKGPDGVEVIPANAILVFDVKLLDFIPQARLEAMRQMMMQQQMQGAQPGAPAPNEAAPAHP